MPLYYRLRRMPRLIYFRADISDKMKMLAGFKNLTHRQIGFVLSFLYNGSLELAQRIAIADVRARILAIERARLSGQLLRIR